MEIKKIFIKEYPKFYLFGIYKDGKLLYKTCDNFKKDKNTEALYVK